MPIQPVSQGSNFVVISHNKNSLTIPVFVTANWNTTVYDSTSERTVNSAKVYFGTSAFGSAPAVAWRVVE